jgi:hypothetical protein
VTNSKPGSVLGLEISGTHDVQLICMDYGQINDVQMTGFPNVIVCTRPCEPFVTRSRKH